MKCDLCKHENAKPNHPLCSSCAEMVQRLIVVNERIHNLEQAEETRSLTISIAYAGATR